MSVLRERVAALSPVQRAELARRLDADGAASARLVAWIVPDGLPPAPDVLRSFLREHLPGHMVPATIVAIDALPRTPAGKLDPGALPEPDDTAATANGTFVAPDDAHERTLAAIWSEVLGGVRVGIHDNFFEIGGDSILSIQVVARAAQAGLRLAPDDLFRHQTIAELARVVSTAPARTPPRASAPLDGTVPLTPIQHWFFEQPLPSPAHWHHVLWLEAERDFDAARLERALRRVVEHHDALRLRFRHERDGWRQVYGAADVRVHTVDLAPLTGPGFEAAARAAADRLAAATDLAAGPLVAALVARRGEACPRVALVIHHLVVDPLSWQILIDDLNASWAQPAEDLPPPSASFGAWAEACVARAGSAELHGELEYWSTAASPEPPLPRDLPGSFTEATAHTVRRSLDADRTRALLDEVPGAYGTHGDEVLLTALVRTLARWTGRPRLRIGLERHGREAIADGLDLSRTVGWFTSFFPVTLALARDAGPGEAIRSIKEQLRAVPRRGIGYGLLRYLSSDADRTRNPGEVDPDIIFNYGGRGMLGSSGDAPFRPVAGPLASRAPENARSHALEVNAFVRDGRLEVHWTHGTEVHGEATVADLADRFLDELRTLIAHCAEPGAGGYTPSDFPESGLSQEELDRFLGGLGR